MLIASIDIETTGLDPNEHQVLEVGVVLWDSIDFTTPVEELPWFRRLVQHTKIVGQAKALVMNARLLEELDRRGGVLPGVVGVHLADWLKAQGVTDFNIAGFNFDGFDRQFLTRLGVHKHVKLPHRTLSPATLFTRPEDKEIPNSDEVFRRAGVEVTDRHTALGDARAVIEVLRVGFGGPGVTVPASPKCPECGDRQTVRVQTYNGDWDDVPCETCNSFEMFGSRLAQYAGLN